MPALGPFNIEHPSGLLAFIIGLVLLLVLLWFVNVPVFSRPYMSGVLTDRAKRIEEQQIQVDRAMLDMQQLRNDYARRLEQVETESRRRIDEAVREADAARDGIIAEARESASALRRRAEEELGRERTRSRILLRRQVVGIALYAAEESIREIDSEPIQRRLVGDFITRVGTSDAPPISITTTEDTYPIAIAGTHLTLEGEQA